VNDIVGTAPVTDALCDYHDRVRTHAKVLDAYDLVVKVTRYRSFCSLEARALVKIEKGTIVRLHANTTLVALLTLQPVDAVGLKALSF
jgi:hypothetical protein